MTKALVAGTKGLAIQANATGAGSRGGDVVVQAGGAAPNGKVDFTADSIQAMGGASAAAGAAERSRPGHSMTASSVVPRAS